jgi:hypothetical protein
LWWSWHCFGWHGDDRSRVDGNLGGDGLVLGPCWWSPVVRCEVARTPGTMPLYWRAVAARTALVSTRSARPSAPLRQAPTRHRISIGPRKRLCLAFFLQERPISAECSRYKKLLFVPVRMWRVTRWRATELPMLSSGSRNPGSIHARSALRRVGSSDQPGPGVGHRHVHINFDRRGGDRVVTLKMEGATTGITSTNQPKALEGRGCNARSDYPGAQS